MPELNKAKEKKLSLLWLMLEEKQTCLLRREWKEIQELLSVFPTLIRIGFFDAISLDSQFTLKTSDLTVRDMESSWCLAQKWYRMSCSLGTHTPTQCELPGDWHPSCQGACDMPAREALFVIRFLLGLYTRPFKLHTSWMFSLSSDISYMWFLIV